MSAMLRLDGSVVFWSIGEWSDRKTIVDGWNYVDSKWAHLAPPERKPNAALRDALRVQFPKAMIRPLEKRDGFAVMQEQRWRDEVTTTTTHAVVVDEHGKLDFRRGYSWNVEQILESEYKRQISMIKTAQVTSSLVQVLSHLNATTLRPSGGIYWLPDSSLPTWVALTDVVMGASIGARNSCYRITHQFDNASILAVRDAIMAEAEREANEIIADVDGGELGERALKTRGQQADRLRSKIEEYERILGELLPEAKAMADKADMAASAAKIMATAAVA